MFALGSKSVPLLLMCLPLQLGSKSYIPLYQNSRIPNINVYICTGMCSSTMHDFRNNYECSIVLLLFINDRKLNAQLNVFVYVRMAASSLPAVIVFAGVDCFYGIYVKGRYSTTVVTMADVCNLSSPPPVDRYNLLLDSGNQVHLSGDASVHLKTASLNQSQKTPRRSRS